MELKQINIPGQRMLHRRVTDVCGPGTSFERLGHQFGDWIALGDGAPEATVGEVEQHVADYLDAAASVGRRWGIVAGILVGLGAGTLIGIATWLFLTVTR
jgi:hypothetical protein